MVWRRYRTLGYESGNGTAQDQQRIGHDGQINRFTANLRAQADKAVGAGCLVDQRQDR
jgi:hypothetical protein